jgi:hypothetical protein
MAVSRLLRTGMIVYLALLATAIAVGASRYGHLYAAMPAPEKARVSVAYGHYLCQTHRLLGVAVGVYSGIFGVSRRNVATSLLVLIAGVTVTVIGYSFLPVHYFPGSDMTAWGIWIGNAYHAAAGVFGATLLMRSRAT